MMKAISKLQILHHWLCSHNLKSLEVVFQSGIYSLQKILDMSEMDQQKLFSYETMNPNQIGIQRAIMDIKDMEQWLEAHNLRVI